MEEVWNDDVQLKSGESLQNLVKITTAVLVLLYLNGLKLSQSFLRKQKMNTVFSFLKGKMTVKYRHSHRLVCSVGTVAREQAQWIVQEERGLSFYLVYIWHLCSNVCGVVLVYTS